MPRSSAAVVAMRLPPASMRESRDGAPSGVRTSSRQALPRTASPTPMVQR